MFRLSIRTGLVLGSQNSITSTLSAMTFSVGSNESEFACVVKVFPSRAYELFTLCKALRRLGRRTGFGPRLYGPLTEQFPGFDKRFVCFPQRQFVAPLCVSPTNSLCDVRYPSEVQSMAYSRDRDFLFCSLCGTMLTLSSVKYATCPLCNYRRSTKEIAGKEIKYRVTAQDIRRELGISTFGEGTLQLATITRKCEKCGNNEFEYTRKQMRSADEGQTTFYTCTKCRDTITEN